MIDTIILRLHDLDRHSTIETFLYNHADYKGKTKVIGERPLASGDTFNTALRQEYIRSRNYKKEFTLMAWSDLDVPSSHYSVKYAIDYLRDFITFNFSIPKYLYGSNITQFVAHPTSRDFSYVDHQYLDYQGTEIYDRLIQFIKYFFKREFAGAKVYWEYLELKRVDLCYNQIFKSKKEAFDYLELQKRMTKSKKRDSSNFYREYDTAVAYRTGSYFFKIYHKGADYKKHDGAEHRKINKKIIKKLGYYRLKKENTENIDTDQLIDVDFLQSVADRMLRYEVSYTNDRMSELYNLKIWGKSDSDYLEQKKYYNALHSQYTLEGYIKFTNEEKEFYEHFKRHIQKKRKFYPFPSTATAMHMRFDKLSDILKDEVQTSVPFTKELVKYMFEEFKLLIDMYQIKELPRRDVVMQRIANYNAEVDFWNKKEMDEALFRGRVPKVKHKLNANRVLTIFNFLETHTLDELRRENIFPKSTIYRYISELKKLKVDKNMMADYSRIIVNTEFTEYYALIQQYQFKMFLKQKLLQSA